MQLVLEEAKKWEQERNQICPYIMALIEWMVENNGKTLNIHMSKIVFFVG